MLRAKKVDSVISAVSAPLNDRSVCSLSGVEGSMREFFIPPKKGGARRAGGVNIANTPLNPLLIEGTFLKKERPLVAPFFPLVA